VPVDPRKIVHGPDYAAVPCTACPALVPVGAVDALRALQERMRHALELADPAGQTPLTRWRSAV
jgi:hypothetical protein